MADWRRDASVAGAGFEYLNGRRTRAGTAQEVTCRGARQIFGTLIEVRTRLTAGGRWIRTLSPLPKAQRFCGSCTLGRSQSAPLYCSVCTPRSTRSYNVNLCCYHLPSGLTGDPSRASPSLLRWSRRGGFPHITELRFVQGNGLGGWRRPKRFLN
jgi:hypothetical protein